MINREIRIMMRINHPTLVKFFWIFKTRFSWYYNTDGTIKNGSLFDHIENVRKCQAHPHYNNISRQIILVGIA